MKTVAVVSVNEAIPFDLATPIEVFGWARDASGSPAYETIVCGPPTRSGSLTMTPDHALDALSRADTVIVPGSMRPQRTQPPEILEAVRDAHRRGSRVASICVGAFTLAQAGLLNGREATTHWFAAGLFTDLFPAVRLTPGKMFQQSGGIYTSAGAAAGLDLCLELIRRDHGTVVAADAARHAVMPLHREGGQMPFILENDEPGGDLHELTTWLTDHLDEPLSLSQIARRAGLSARTLNRRFHERYARSPMTWLLEARIRRARELLTGSTLPVERIAAAAGFGSPENLRVQFKRATGVSPQSFRRSFSG